MSEYDGQSLYGRRYRVIVGTSGGGIDVSQLRCVFTIEKSMAETPNYSEISIYNLSPETENKIIKSSERVIVEAGYEGDQYGLIFDGDIIQPLRSKEDGVTYKLTLISQDGDLFINSGIINASFRAGQTPRNIVNEVTAKSSNTLQLGSISENLTNKSLARGKVCFGLSRDYLRQLAKSEEAGFYDNDRQVNIVKATDLPSGRVIDLNPKSGLIGIPEQSEDGVNGQCLLNPLINLNSLIHIDSSLIRIEKAKRDSKPKQLDQDGIYRVIKLKITGDTRGQSWYTEFTGISQVGNIPVTGESMK